MLLSGEFIYLRQFVFVLCGANLSSCGLIWQYLSYYCSKTAKQFCEKRKYTIRTELNII